MPTGSDRRADSRWLIELYCMSFVRLRLPHGITLISELGNNGRQSMSCCETFGRDDLILNGYNDQVFGLV
jgi:hypothetical protein